MLAGTTTVCGGAMAPVVKSADTMPSPNDAYLMGWTSVPLSSELA